MTEHRLDASGLICPMPVLKARKALLALLPGDILRVTVTDVRALSDFELFCKETGHGMAGVATLESGFEVSLCRAPHCK